VWIRGLEDSWLGEVLDEEEMIIFYALHVKLLSFNNFLLQITFYYDFKDGKIMKRPKVTHADAKQGTLFFLA